MRMCLAIGFVLSTAAAAAAQPDASSVSLNISAGSVGSTSGALPGATAQLMVGTDLRISRNWEIRFDVGRRSPSRRSWEPQSLYYRPDPDDPSRSIEVETIQRASEETLADIAVLARRSWNVRERFETALLAGVDMRVVRHRFYLAVPLNPADPASVEVYDSTNVRTHMVFDMGVEGGVRLGNRWRVLAYGIAGMQNPEHGRSQLRAGLTLKRLF